MSAHWWWSWGIGLPTASYNTSQWTLVSSSDITTNNTTFLNSPVGALTPGETKNLKILGPATIATPNFQNGAVSKGWVVFRWNPNSGGLGRIGFLYVVCHVRNGSSNVITLLPSQTGAVSALSLYVNGTLVGTSVDTFGQCSSLLAIDFDLTTTPPEAGLVAGGLRQIARAAGSSIPTTINNVLFSSGENVGAAYIGDIMVFNDLADFTDSTTQNVWVACLHPDTATDSDNSWTPNAGTDVTAASDGNPATWTESIDRPDTISYTFQNRADVLVGWAPVTVWGCSVVVYATTEWSPNVSLVLDDNAVAVGAPTVTTVDADGSFSGRWSAVNAAGTSWTGAQIDTLSADYTVNS